MSKILERKATLTEIECISCHEMKPKIEGYYLRNDGKSRQTVCIDCCCERRKQLYKKKNKTSSIEGKKLNLVFVKKILTLANAKVSYTSIAEILKLEDNLHISRVTVRSVALGLTWKNYHEN